MVSVKTFDNETEAHLAKDYLQVREITAQIVGAKEYTAHILGGGAGHFELMVDPIHLQMARDLLAQLNGPEALAIAEAKEPPNYFRRAIFYAFTAAIVLPIVFNYASIVNAVHFWKNSKRDLVAVLKLILIGLLQLIPIIGLIFLLKSMYNSNSGLGF